MSGLPLIACPVCQAEYGLEVALGQDDARGVVREMARCPADAATRKALMRYAALFAPLKQRTKWGRVESILAEINGWMETARVERGGRVWAVPAWAYLAAIETIEAMPTLRRPLKSHGLLLEILTSQIDRAEAQAERAVDTKARGHTPTATSAAHKPFQPEAPAPARNPKAAAEALAKAKNLLTKGA